MADILEEAEWIAQLAEAIQQTTFPEVWERCSWELHDDTEVKSAAERLYNHLSGLYKQNAEDPAEVTYLLSREKAVSVAGFIAGVLWARKLAR